jgi:hypothetical protein
VLTEDAEFAFIINSSCFESKNGEKYWRLDEFNGDPSYPAVLKSPKKVKMEDLILNEDTEISSSQFLPLKISYKPAKIGNLALPLRWESWVRPIWVGDFAKVKVPNAAEGTGLPLFFDSFSPHMLELLHKFKIKGSLIQSKALMFFEFGWGFFDEAILESAIKAENGNIYFDEKSIPLSSPFLQEIAGNLQGAFNFAALDFAFNKPNWFSLMQAGFSKKATQLLKYLQSIQDSSSRAKTKSSIPPSYHKADSINQAAKRMPANSSYAKANPAYATSGQNDRQRSAQGQSLPSSSLQNPAIPLVEGIELGYKEEFSALKSLQEYQAFEHKSSAAMPSYLGYLHQDGTISVVFQILPSSKKPASFVMAQKASIKAYQNEEKNNQHTIYAAQAGKEDRAISVSSQISKISSSALLYVISHKLSLPDEFSKPPFLNLNSYPKPVVFQKFACSSNLLLANVVSILPNYSLVHVHTISNKPSIKLRQPYLLELLKNLCG